MPLNAYHQDIQIIAYVAVNDIQHLSDDDSQISRYVRSFRYEQNGNPLISRRMAFNKLLDEKEARLFGCDGDSAERFRGLSLYMEYLIPAENGRENTRELKKLFLLTGEPMSTGEQLCRWEKELELLRKAYPEIESPVMPVSDEGDKMTEVLDTTYFTALYYFFET